MNKDFYFEFEKQFRGTRDNIIKRLSVYDDLLKTLVYKFDNPNVLDIGCGRGEWLEKCIENDLDSVGIDSDEQMINFCLDNGLKVEKGDLFQVLPLIPSSTYTLVSCFHVIEHLTSDQIFILFSEIYRILKDDGIVLIETPSIDNLLVSCKTFYLDPTHINHINPEGVLFLLNNIGFYDSKYFLLNSGPLSEVEPVHLTRILNGVAEDVMLISVKSINSAELLFNDKNKWIKSLPKNLSTLEAAIEYDLVLNNKMSFFKDEIYQLQNNLNGCKNEIIELKRLLNDRGIRKKLSRLASRINLKFIIRFLLKKLRSICKFTFLLFSEIIFIIIKSLKIYKLPYFNTLFYTLLKAIIKSLKKFGYSFSATMLESKFEITKTFKANSMRFNDRLSNYYENSELSSSIHDRIKITNYRKSQGIK